jgi:ParB-like chromosome segregation protein Spo0J
MTYQVRIESPAIREAKLQASVQASSETRDFYDFRNQKTQLKLVRIASDLLVYRMENFRTYIDQHSIIIRDQKPTDFFLAGQENESVQQLQHEILAQLARKGRADSVTPVIDVLKTEKQREPLLITNRGVVVNGNRRLAAMRELLDEDRTANAEFTHVDCLVLPADVTPEEIVDIEARLQAKPETKLDYDWIGDCLLIQKLLDLGRTPAQVAERLNRKPAEIRNSLAALGEANVYLKDWAKAQGDYTRVRDAEQFFKDLPGLVHPKEEGLAEASRVIAWNLYDNRDQLDERLYAFNVVIGKNAAEVLDRVASELGIPLTSQPPEDDDPFDVDIDPGVTPTTYQPVIDALRDPDKRDEALDVLIEVTRGTIEKERGRKSSGAALKAIITANSRLSEVDLSRADGSDYGAIDRQLEQIGKRVTELRKTVDLLRTAAAPEPSVDS